MVVFIVYVDDIVITIDDFNEINKLKASLALRFEIKDLGSLRYFFGWLKRILKELQLPLTLPIKLYCVTTRLQLVFLKIQFNVIEPSM
uniref:Reverse transcriptase Ty1/copia-type domain-containing protein n=1 Tax=Cajanus cajan TaxID=3821 RepID=A0A151RZ20_CAJCA|nr:hypothetical protein KK1_030571 [Cajanus cajan]